MRVGWVRGKLVQTATAVREERESGVLWAPFTHAGRTYDLAHLHPISITFAQPPKKDKPARSYIVNVIFGLHCFTRGYATLEAPDTALLYSDSREQRIFDFPRYELSKQLPQIIAGLPTRKCYHTGHGNFFTIEAMDENNRPIEYEIYFTVSRSRKRGVSLNLFVQSAYARDGARGRPDRKPIAFTVILYNTLNNRLIRAPK